MTSQQTRSAKQWHRGTSIILGIEIAMCGVAFLMVSTTQANGPSGGGVSQPPPQPGQLPLTINTDDVAQQSANLTKAWFNSVEKSPPPTPVHFPEPSAAPQPSPSTEPEPADPKKPAPTRAKVATRELLVPVRYNYVSRRLIAGVHTGIDFVTDIGTPVHAALGGTVVTADAQGWNSGWGRTVVIDHGSGLTTRYAHLQSIELEVGQDIPQGGLVGRSGNTGRSTGPHLHFEARRNSRPFDPYI